MQGYMSAKEAQEVLGVSRGRISQLVKAGKLDAEIIGNSFAITEESVRRWLEENPGPGNPKFGPGYSPRWDKREE